jgi:hypothetical protein
VTPDLSGCRLKMRWKGLKLPLLFLADLWISIPRRFGAEHDFGLVNDVDYFRTHLTHTV